MKTYAFIFARGGSKGVPRKNVQLLNEKPLLAHSIELSHSLDFIDRVFVSTDNDEIISIADQWGAEVICRPESLAQDTSPEWLAWKHAVDFVEVKYGAFDRFISLPATSPLRAQEDIVNCFNRLDNETDIVITVSEATRSPWFNMVKLDPDGYASIVNRKENSPIRRQDAPLVYDITTVAYMTRPTFIRSASGIFDGRVGVVVVPQERALDIDTETDLLIARALAARTE